MTTTIDGPSLIKRLGSCNKSVRDKTLDLLLRKWLPFQTQIADDDMKKLWKGLFYCVWHSDKAPVQAALADRLSSVLPSLRLPLATHYFSVFLLTMRREWTGIDALRLDKFYLLIRRFLHYLFVVLRKCCRDLEVVKRVVGVLVDSCLLADDKLVGCGVSYHVVSIFVDEIRPFLPLKREVVEELFSVFVVVMGRVQDKVLVGKIKSCVFDVLLKMGCGLLEAKKKGLGEGEGEGEVEDDVVVLGTVAVVMGFSGKFYEMGSSVECWQGNRKVLFRLHEEFLKLEKDIASSGVAVSIPEVSFDDEEEEVPTLVPIVNEMEVDGGGDVGEGLNKKVLKKCKKADKGGRGKEEKGKKPKKKKKKNVESSVVGMEENVVSANGDFSVEGEDSISNLVSFNESVISNLQMQFEKVAAEVGMVDGALGTSCDLQNGAVNGTLHKKRKRVKGSDGQHSQAPEANSEADVEGCGTTGKSGKKVRFSMKSNLVWKPQSPLPPQSLRLPPSVTPRGSALKKGVAPGPIREMPVVMKKAKQRAKSMKKARKVIKIKNPALKSVKKLKSLST